MNEKKILIIEDQIPHARKLESQLNDLGYENINICRNDKEALPLIKEGNFDLALVDIGLENSNLNGIALAAKIADHHNIPIIFITSFSDENNIQNAMDTASVNYLVKPVSNRQLFATISQAFAKSQQATRIINHTSSCPFKVEKEYMYIPENKGGFYKLVHIEDFNYAASRGNYVDIFTNKGAFTIPITLKSFIEQFNNSNIIRVSSSHDVNKVKITERNSKVMIFSDRNIDPVKIGKKKKKEVDKQFET
ncbi:MAG: response regulator transcription factor, partial [Bacteroidetes bacterium]|nr:response regulator transcription factor [Bacteroidota bacterium]